MNEHNAEDELTVVREKFADGSETRPGTAFARGESIRRSAHLKTNGGNYKVLRAPSKLEVVDLCDDEDDDNDAVRSVRSPKGPSRREREVRTPRVSTQSGTRKEAEGVNQNGRDESPSLINNSSFSTRHSLDRRRPSPHAFAKRSMSMERPRKRQRSGRTEASIAADSSQAETGSKAAKESQNSATPATKVKTPSKTDQAGEASRHSTRGLSQSSATPRTPPPKFRLPLGSLGSTTSQRFTPTQTSATREHPEEHLEPENSGSFTPRVSRTLSSSNVSPRLPSARNSPRLSTAIRREDEAGTGKSKRAMKETRNRVTANSDNTSYVITGQDEQEKRKNRLPNAVPATEPTSDDLARQQILQEASRSTEHLTKNLSDREVLGGVVPDSDEENGEGAEDIGFTMEAGAGRRKVNAVDAEDGSDNYNVFSGTTTNGIASFAFRRFLELTKSGEATTYLEPQTGQKQNSSDPPTRPTDTGGPASESPRHAAIDSVTGLSRDNGDQAGLENVEEASPIDSGLTRVKPVDPEETAYGLASVIPVEAATELETTLDDHAASGEAANEQQPLATVLDEPKERRTRESTPQKGPTINIQPPESPEQGENRSRALTDSASRLRSSDPVAPTKQADSRINDPDPCFFEDSETPLTIPDVVAGADDEPTVEDTSALRTSREASSASLSLPPGTIELPIGVRVNNALDKHLAKFREDHERSVKSDLEAARNSARVASLSGIATRGSTTAAVSSFFDIDPPTAEVDPGHVTIGNFTTNSVKSTIRFPRTVYRTDEEDVPPYTQYISIKHNVLGESQKQLHIWPRVETFGDEDVQGTMERGLVDKFDVDVDDRPRKLLRLQQAQQLEAYAESFLKAVGCSMSDVLRFLLEPSPLSVDFTDFPDAKSALRQREAFCKEDFDRSSERWITVLSRLPPTNTESLAVAAKACEAFQRATDYGLWSIAKRSSFAQPEQSDDSQSELACRICFRQACPYHGEIREFDDEDAGYESAQRSVVAKDIDNPPEINYKAHVLFPTRLAESGLPAETRSVQASPQKREKRRNIDHWVENTQTARLNDRPTFYPCSHPGKSCEEAYCSCCQSDVMCEKSCACSPSCSRRYHGCTCKATRARRGEKPLCFDDDRCECFRLYRECDPDLCGSCGVDTVLDPENRDVDYSAFGLCSNLSIQMGIPKRTLVGTSKVHGFGLYIGEEVRAGEFVGEYKGEQINGEEDVRRGDLYHYQNLSYLFQVNEGKPLILLFEHTKHKLTSVVECELDSTRFGNKIRFINHATSDPNIRAKVLLVNTVARIGFYANRDLHTGEELFFNYGKAFWDGHKKSAVSKEAPRAKNQELLETYWSADATNAERDRLTKKSEQKRAKKGVALDKDKGKIQPVPIRGRPRKETGRQARKSDQEILPDAGLAPPGERLMSHYVSDTGASDDLRDNMDQEEDDFEPGKSQSEGSESEDGAFDEDDDDDAVGGARRLDRFPKRKIETRARGR